MAQESRTRRSSQLSPGIYLGQVVNHLDSTFMGGIEVQILSRRGSSANYDLQPCRYGSPFLGSTPYSGATRNDDYASTQKGYGFWAVPPDIGSQVVVVMPEGNFAEAIWIAVVAEPAVNFMIPGYASTTFNKDDPSKALPVGEYNKRTTSTVGTDPNVYIKPVNTDFYKTLATLHWKFVLIY